MRHKWQFSNMIDSCASLAQTGSGRGVEFLASVAGWCENHHTKVEVCSCYRFQVISILKWKLRKCVIWSLSSYRYLFTVKNVGWGCILNSFILSSLPCFLAFADLLTLNFERFFFFFNHVYVTFISSRCMHELKDAIYRKSVLTQ